MSMTVLRQSNQVTNKPIQIDILLIITFLIFSFSQLYYKLKRIRSTSKSQIIIKELPLLCRNIQLFSRKF